ncbi:MAG: Lrp/AsnC family transcriptional regulator [Alphaproteobacteria bacterium]|nr:Lrp/AsnC family transcriptional regulator [Alphaproteobacteria bacterium]
MRRLKLDQIDKKILKNLQQEGRITNVELAQRVGISAPPCLRRVRVLEESGYIKSYHAKIDLDALGYSITVFAFVKLTGQSDSDLVEFEKFVMQQSLIRECTLLAGDVDFILKIIAKDWDSYQDFHKNKLIKAPHVTSVKSSLAIRVFKDELGIPM